MVVKDAVAFVRSTVASHFTDALVQYASEYEDLSIDSTGKGEARCYITSLRLISRQNLAWAVAFYSKDSRYQTNFNNDTTLDFWKFAAGDALATATAYIYAVTGMKIPYRDENNTGELHVGLHNQSATAKTAGTVGSVHITVGLIAGA